MLVLVIFLTILTIFIFIKKRKKEYDVCSRCGQIVQTNKFLFGPLHPCSEDGNDIHTSQIIRNRYLINLKILQKRIADEYFKNKKL